jgi:hypothetical protein
MKDYLLGILLFIIIAYSINYFTPLNYLESFGCVFFGVLLKGLYDNITK